MSVSPPRGRVAAISLGCAKNLVDTEILLGRLRQAGFEIVSEAEADTLLVNTCAFIEEARKESIDTILEAVARKEQGDLSRLVVAGCLVQRSGSDLARELPEVDAFVGLDDLARVTELVELRSTAVPEGTSNRIFDHGEPRLLSTGTHAYLKVAEGCNNPCTFCAIPHWRGRFRSRQISSLLLEAQRLESTGARELCLIAQDTTRYGEDLGYGRHGLMKLLERLLAETSFPWIRFLYAYPTTLDPELLRLMASESRLVPYLDLPLQHSHPKILRRMRRGGSADRYLRLLDLARERVPGIFLRTTFIVGFPGETEEEFHHLLGFVDRARFDHLGAFIYSPEAGTPAASLSDRPPQNVARRRYRQLLTQQRPISLASRKRLVGQTVTVLVEGPCRETELLLEGRHAGMAPEVDGRVLLRNGAARPGELVQAAIERAYATDLVGQVLSSTAVPAAVLPVG